MKRFLSGITISSLLVGVILPCFAMEHPGLHAHAIPSPTVHEHSHAPTAQSSSGDSHSDGPEREACCHDNLLAALYEKPSKKKGDIVEAAVNHIHPNIFLLWSVAFQLSGDVTGQYHGVGLVSLTVPVCSSSLFDQRTLLLC